MDRIYRALKIRILAYLRDNNLTQARFARDLGCKPSVLSMFLRNHRTLSLPLICRARDILGITFGDLDGPVSEAPLEVELMKGHLATLFLESPNGFRTVKQMVDTLLQSARSGVSDHRRGQASSAPSSVSYCV